MLVFRAHHFIRKWEILAQDELNSNSLKYSPAFERILSQIYRYYHFYKLFSSWGSQLTCFCLFPQVFCNFPVTFSFPKINAKMSATVLIMKLQIKFLSLTFFLFTGEDSIRYSGHYPQTIFLYALYLICKGYNKWLETAVSGRIAPWQFNYSTQRTRAH